MEVLEVDTEVACVRVVVEVVQAGGCRRDSPG